MEPRPTLEEFKEYLRDKDYAFEETTDGLNITAYHNIYLHVETLPDNITFSNKGSVNLNDLEVLPKNIKFDNAGFVNLAGLKSEKQTYLGEEIILKTLDDITHRIYSEKKKDDYIFYRSKCLSGSSYKHFKGILYTVQRGNKIWAEVNLNYLLRDIFEDFDVFNFIKEEDF